ncbi:MAG: hypothetical protein OXF79_20980 [Chloroflexi bacterium]|nr:hypothetical protein [Chloroflexota bacterium]
MQKLTNAASPILVAVFLVVALLACTTTEAMPAPAAQPAPDSDFSTLEPPLSESPHPAMTAPAIASTPRDVGHITVLQPRIEGAMSDYEILDVETLMESGLHGFGASPAHIVVRGAPSFGSVRCEWHGLARTAAQRESALRLVLDLDDTDTIPSTEQARTTLTSYVALLAPEFRDAMQTNLDHIIDGGLLDESRILACYVDYKVSAYLVGAGPTTLTVAYDNLAKSRSYELYKKAHAAGRYGDATLQTPETYAATDAQVLDHFTTELTKDIVGRESVLLLVPMGAHSNIAVEVWQTIAQWDVQTRNGMQHAVRYGVDEHEPGHSQILANLESRISVASKTDAHAGKRITDASGLNKYYRDIGAYDDITPGDGLNATFIPDQPPPVTWDCSNGKAVPPALSNPGLLKDCETLLGLRDTLAGNVALNWHDQEYIGRWQGVYVYDQVSEYRVQEIALTGLGLSGTVPPELGNLDELGRLELQSNKLTGSVPAELGDLKDLGTLGLGNNALTGSIPAELGSLPRLSWLNLGNNGLTGEIPVTLVNLGRMENLILRNNQLTGGIPAGLENLTNLVHLRLDSNQLTGAIPSELGSSPRLRRMVLSGNRLTGQIPSTLGNIATLDQLWLDGNQLSGAIPSELGRLAKVTDLALTNNQLTGTIPPELGNMSLLRYLDLAGNSLTGSIPSQLGNLANLEGLRLQDNGLTGALPAELENLARLTGLYVGNNSLTGCIPAKLLAVAGNDLSTLELQTCPAP